MKKILTGLVVVAGFFFAVNNSADAAISVITTPASTNGSRIYLKFDGTALIITDNSGYSLRIDYSSTNISLGDRNSIYTGDGFTATGSVVLGTAISSDLTYSGNYFSSSLPTSASYGFKYGTGLVGAPVFHYGWVNLTASGSGITRSLTLNSAAINTTPGQSILAGQTAVTAVPEPGMWVPSLLLVVGVAFRWRRPRSKATVV